MPRILENPDRDFSAIPIDEPEGDASLRNLLRKSEIADLFDPVVRERVGELIGQLGFDPSEER